MYFRNVERSSTLGEGEGINPSPSREPDIWRGGGGGEIAESRYSSRALESIGGENWRGENGGGGGLLNVTSTLASSRLHFSSRLCYEANYA